MKLLISLVLSLALAHNCEEFFSSNEVLQDSIRALESQLKSLSPQIPNILQDLESEKKLLHGLVQSYNSNPSLITAEKITQVLHSISIDLSLLSDPPESISKIELDIIIQNLTRSIQRARLLKEHKEFSRIYNKLLKKTEEKDEKITELLKENKELSDSSQKLKDLLVKTKKNLKDEENSVNELSEQLDEQRKEEDGVIGSLEEKLKDDEEKLKNENVASLKKIQESQNELIGELQKNNLELTLKVEQAQTDLADLQNEIKVSKASCESFKEELDSRSSQLVECETNFEDFRRKVELENIDQIQVLKDSEITLQSQLSDLQTERAALQDIYTNCTKELTEKIIENNLKENIIKGLNNDLEHADNSVESAKQSRSQEVEILHQSISNLKNTLASLQKQYDDALGKILSQSTTINDLEAKIEDYQYISQRNLRG